MTDSVCPSSGATCMEPNVCAIYFLILREMNFIVCRLTSFVVFSITKTYAWWWCWSYGIRGKTGWETIGTGMASRLWCGSWWIGCFWISDSWWCGVVHGAAHHVYNGCRLYGFQISGRHGSSTVHDLDLTSSFFSSASAHSANAQMQRMFNNWNEEYKNKKHKFTIRWSSNTNTEHNFRSLDLWLYEWINWNEMMSFQTESSLFIVKMVEVKKGENVIHCSWQQLNNILFIKKNHTKTINWSKIWNTKCYVMISDVMNRSQRFQSSSKMYYHNLLLIMTYSKYQIYQMSLIAA